MASTKHPNHWQRDEDGSPYSFGVWIYVDGKFVRQVACDLATEQEARAIASRCTGDVRIQRFTLIT